MVLSITARRNELAIVRWQIQTDDTLTFDQKAALLRLTNRSNLGPFDSLLDAGDRERDELDHTLGEIDERVARKRQFRDLIAGAIAGGAGGGAGRRRGRLPNIVRHPPGMPALRRPDAPHQARHFDNSARRFQQFRPRGDRQPAGTFNRGALEAFRRTDAAPLTREENVRRGMAAFDIMIMRVRRGRDGFVTRAMHRKGIGDIAFQFGRPGNPQAEFKGGQGFSHLIAKHGIEVVEDVIETIARGTIVVSKGGRSQSGRIVLEYNQHRVVLQNLPNSGNRNWVITGYRRSEKGFDLDRRFDLHAIDGPLFFRSK